MIEQLTDPTDAISVAEAKALLRLESTDSDGLLAGNLEAAREMLERDTSRRFGARSVRLTLDGWPLDAARLMAFAGNCADEITIPVAPVTAVTSIEYDGLAGVTVWDPSNYLVRPRHGLTRIRLATGKSWPDLADDGQVRIAFTAGESPIGEEARRAICQLAAYWFDNPFGAVSEGYRDSVNRLKMLWL